MLTRTRWRVAVTLVPVALAVAGCSGSGSSGGTATGTVTSAPTSKPTAAKTTKPAKQPAVPATATGKPSVAISLAAVVKIGKPAQILNDVQVKVGKVTEVTVTAGQPGEIAGAAAAVPVTVVNTSGKPFSLNGLVVTASYHNGVPGNETSAKPSNPLTGSLAVGKSASGTYVFMIPRQYASTLHLEVSSDQSPTIVQFAR